MKYAGPLPFLEWKAGRELAPQRPRPAKSDPSGASPSGVISMSSTVAEAVDKFSKR